MRLKISYLLGFIVLGILIYGAGIMTGITYEGHLSQWSRDIDMSDYISMVLISLLSVALLLSLKRK